MSNMDRQTSAVLRAGTVLGIGIMAIGLLLTSFDISEDILTAGIGILIFTPVAGPPNASGRRGTGSGRVSP